MLTLDEVQSRMILLFTGDVRDQTFISGWNVSVKSFIFHHATTVLMILKRICLRQTRRWRPLWSMLRMLNPMMNND